MWCSPADSSHEGPDLGDDPVLIAHRARLGPPSGVCKRVCPGESTRGFLLRPTHETTCAPSMCSVACRRSALVEWSSRLPWCGPPGKDALTNRDRPTRNEEKDEDMKAGTRGLLTKMVVVAAMVGASATASAKTIGGWIQEQSFTMPNGTTFTTCSGSPIFAASYAYDSSNVLQGGVRSYAIGGFLTQTAGATAVKYQASLRSVAGATFCSSAQVAWGGLWTPCSTPSNYRGSSSSGLSCASMTLTSFSRGY